jgi:hypothetical protein
LLAGDGRLTIDAPQDALTPDLLDRLKAHKADVVAMLRARARSGPGPARANERSPSEAHQAGLPMRFDHLARRADSRRAIRPAGLRPLWAVSRLSRLVRQ